MDTPAKTASENPVAFVQFCMILTMERLLVSYIAMTVTKLYSKAIFNLPCACEIKLYVPWRIIYILDLLDKRIFTQSL